MSSNDHYLSWATLLSIPILLFTTLFFTGNMVKQQYPRLRNKKICLLIAHPDDEAMFFSPTITGLTDPELGNHVKILCLSSGNAEGLGETRKSELNKSASILGLRSESDVFIIDQPNFPDSMTATWAASEISSLLTSAFATTSTASSSSSKSKKGSSTTSSAPSATIDVLITFDAHGVSQHPNHISLYNGAKHFMQNLLRGKSGYASPIDLYTLTSINLVRKYIGLLDVFPTLTMVAFGKKVKGRGMESALVFVGDTNDVLKGQKAMVKAHVSQMRWFRWAWIGVSRYMYVNDLRLVKV